MSRKKTASVMCSVTSRYRSSDSRRARASRCFSSALSSVATSWRTSNGFVRYPKAAPLIACTALATEA